MSSLLGAESGHHLPADDARRSSSARSSLPGSRSVIGPKRLPDRRDALPVGGPDAVHPAHRQWRLSRARCLSRTADRLWMSFAFIPATICATAGVRPRRPDSPPGLNHLTAVRRRAWPGDPGGDRHRPDERLRTAPLAAALHVAVDQALISGFHLAFFVASRSPSSARCGHVRDADLPNRLVAPHPRRTRRSTCDAPTTCPCPHNKNCRAPVRHQAPVGELLEHDRVYESPDARLGSLRSA